jgi:hypothetical protein
MKGRDVRPTSRTMPFRLGEANGLPTANQIFHAKIGQVDSTATINWGDTMNVSPSSNVKDIGGSFPIGDFPLNITGSPNQAIDPDIIDQAGEVRI